MTTIKGTKPIFFRDNLMFLNLLPYFRTNFF